MIKTITKHMSSTDVIAEIYDTIRVGDYGAYVLNLVLDDLESISGDVRLRFERSDGQIILTAPVTVSGNTIIHELTASEIAVVSPLNMWVQFSESNLYTPIQIVFDQVLAVPSGTPIPDTDEYPEYLAAIEAAEAATAEVEAIIGMGIVVEDQTTPQTFINGVPKLAADRVIDQDNELSDKKYVDDKVATVTADDFDHNDLDGLQGGGANERYHMTAAENAALHAHSNKTALDAVSGVNTGDQSASSFNHDDLSNKNGGADYQHMTAAQMAALHSHSNKAALDAVSGTNTGDQDVDGAISTHNSDAAAHGGAIADIDHAEITIKDNATFTDTLIFGGGGTLISRTGVNPIDPLPFEQDGSYNGLYNTFFGRKTGDANTTGNGNTFLGSRAGRYNLNGDQNTFVGWQAGMANIDGYHNTFIGVGAGEVAQHTYFNTFIGCDCGLSLATGNANVLLGTSCDAKGGNNNVFIGSGVGNANSVGSSNIFIGYTGIYNTTGNKNVFVGHGAGFATTTAGANTFIGCNCGKSNQTGSNNCGVGDSALENATGTYNNALGRFALNALLAGARNDAIGYQSLTAVTSGNDNVGIGYRSGLSLTTGSSNTFLGNQSNTTLNSIINSTAIGFGAIVGASNTVQIGNASITNVAAHGDFEAQDIGDGFICKSPNGTRYRITVADGGTISIAAA